MICNSTVVSFGNHILLFTKRYNLRLSPYFFMSKNGNLFTLNSSISHIAEHTLCYYLYF